MSNLFTVAIVFITLFCIGIIMYEINEIHLEREREKRRCVNLIKRAADYSELEAKSVAYVLAQTYPRIMLEALVERFENEI